MLRQLISDEKFTNIQRAQAGLTKLFEEAGKTMSFYRVMKNDKPLGVLVHNEMWEDFLEDIEALSSPAYLARIRKARAQKKRVSAKQIKQSLSLD